MTTHAQSKTKSTKSPIAALAELLCAAMNDATEFVGNADREWLDVNHAAWKALDEGPIAQCRQKLEAIEGRASAKVAKLRKARAIRSKLRWKDSTGLLVSAQKYVFDRFGENEAAKTVITKAGEALRQIDGADYDSEPLWNEWLTEKFRTANTNQIPKFRRLLKLHPIRDALIVSQDAWNTLTQLEAVSVSEKPTENNVEKQYRLSDLQDAILEFLYREKSFDYSTRRTSTIIADGVDSQPDAVKKAAGRLKKIEFVDSEPTSKGGYWLTVKGADYAAKIK